MSVKSPSRPSAIQLCYVRLAISRPEAAAAFATEVLGLEHIPNKLEPYLYRSDQRYHTLCLTAGAERPSIGIEISDAPELDRVAEALAHSGMSPREATTEECARRFVHRALVVTDATGNEINLVLRPAQSGRRYFPSRDAGVTGLQGVGLRSRAVKDDLRLWTILGAEVTDRVGEITYDALMQNSYFVQERQIKIMHGPGRETASGQMFLRFAGPEGYVFSYGSGLSDLGPQHRPRQFTPEASSLCEWGSVCADIAELLPVRTG